MRLNSSGDTGSYFIVGALIVVITAVVLILSGRYPLYGDRRANVTISTPHAEISRPHRWLG